MPPPQRQSFEPAIGAITQAAMGASEDIKATTGIYDASLGAQARETSGVAIARRANQSQTSNFHFVDNLTRSIRHCGRIIVQALPKYYDAQRVARIIGEEGDDRIVQLNSRFIDQGKEVIYDLSAGKYDVTIDVGPSFQTKRQEAAASMLDLSKANPQIMGIAGDLLVKNLDWPGAQEIAERLKKTLPPGIADDDKSKAQEIPPQAQAQMQQMNQMIEQLTAKLNDAQSKLETKQVELESKERIEMAKLETQATIELAKLQSNEALKLLAHQIAELDQRTQMLGFAQPTNEAASEPQEFQQSDDGAIGAYVDGIEQQPTGGFSPGQSVEGQLP